MSLKVLAARVLARDTGRDGWRDTPAADCPTYLVGGVAALGQPAVLPPLSSLGGDGDRTARRCHPSPPGATPPAPGSWFGCCGGRAWWCEREQPSGWRCVTCYTPDHLPAEDVREVRT